MAYSIYLRVGGRSYKLPTNPESIEMNRSLNTQSLTVLGGKDVLIPTSTGLFKIKFSFEIPSTHYHYLNTGVRVSADYYEKMLRKAQDLKQRVRFIASNEINDDISIQALITALSIKEEAGQEGDKQVSIELTEYKKANKRYRAIEVRKEEAPQAKSIPQAKGVPQAKSIPQAKKSGRKRKNKGNKKQVIYKKTVRTDGEHTKAIVEELQRKARQAVADKIATSPKMSTKELWKKRKDRGGGWKTLKFKWPWEKR